MTLQNAKPEQYLLEMRAELPSIHFQMVKKHSPFLKWIQPHTTISLYAIFAR